MGRHIREGSFMGTGKCNLSKVVDSYCMEKICRRKRQVQTSSQILNGCSVVKKRQGLEPIKIRTSCKSHLAIIVEVRLIACDKSGNVYRNVLESGPVPKEYIPARMTF